MTCTTPDCGNPTDLYLCRDCVRDLQAWIDKARELLPDLEVTILRLDNVRRRSEGGNGGKSGSAAPLNIDAFQLRENIRTLTARAETYAHDPNAAGIATLIRTWATNAELAVLGAEDTWSATCQCGATVTSTKNSGTCENCGTNATRKQFQAQMARSQDDGPLDAKELVEWVKDKTGHIIRESQIYNWAHRGHITPVQTNPPKYDPLAVVISRGLHKRSDPVV